MGIPAVSFPKDGPTKTNQPKQTIEQPNETKITETNNKTSTPKSSINGVHAVVQHRGAVPSSALQKPTRGRPNTSHNSLKTCSIVSPYRSWAWFGGTWPRIGEKSQHCLKRITWVVSISRGVTHSLQSHFCGVAAGGRTTEKQDPTQNKLRVGERLGKQ